MKKTILISLFFSFLSFTVFSQTKKPVTTTKKVPVKTTTKTTTKTTATKTVVKPATTTVAPTPPPAKVEEPPKDVPAKEPSGPPVTGPTGDGPKSYTNDTKSKSTTTKSTTATKSTATKTTVAKTTTPKPEKVKTMSSDETVRSYIGLRGGYNLATLQDLLKATLSGAGGTAKASNLAGYMGGIVINIGVSKSFSIQPEILYSQQGGEIKDATYFARVKEDVVNVPLLLKVAFGSPKMKFFINAGPYVGYRLSRKSETNIGGSTATETIDFITDYDVNGEKDNRIDFGGIGGAGLQFNLGGPLLTLEGRYQYGMADPTLYKNGKPAEVGDLLHNRVITGTLGILFPLGGK